MCAERQLTVPRVPSPFRKVPTVPGNGSHRPPYRGGREPIRTGEGTRNRETRPDRCPEPAPALLAEAVWLLDHARFDPWSGPARLATEFRRRRARFLKAARPSGRDTDGAGPNDRAATGNVAQTRTGPR